MTREEALEVIKAYRNRLINSVSNQLDKDIEALDMAIQALSQEPTTPIPDNATFGDVIEKITNRKPLEDNKDADNIIISTKLWNAPYQKGGK